MPWRQWIPGSALAVAAVVATAALSNAPLQIHSDDAGAVRLAWSMRPDRIETCRRLSNEELEQRPAHMRLSVECEGRSARYRLVVMLDHDTLDNTLLHGGGVRQDRPIYVFREYRAEAGTHRLRVIQVLEDTAASSAAPAADENLPDSLIEERAGREDQERERRRSEAVPASLTLDTLVRVESRRVLLLTYSAEERRFQLIGRLSD